MKVYNEKHNGLTENILNTLQLIRQIRSFNVENYIKAKTYLINQYLIKSKLNSIVLGVSGGIDSAVSLGLLDNAKKQLNSPIKNIMPIFIPSFDGSVSNQLEAQNKAKELSAKLGYELSIIDISNLVKQSNGLVMENSFHKNNKDPWAVGQLVSYLRTPLLYYHTSILSANGQSGIIAGTINRDEGAYLGYLCKSGDACVDIQVISDLHKSEVYKVAQKLKIPENIIKAIPTGDMFDARSDEEVFGAPYDFVELLIFIKNCSDNLKRDLLRNWNMKDYEIYKKYTNNLEKLHNYNAHKYSVGSSAVHLDVMESAVKNGWQKGIHTSIHKHISYMNIKPHKFVGLIEPPKIDEKYVLNMKKICKSINKDIVIGGNALLSNIEKEGIIKSIQNNKEKMIGTNQYGIPSIEHKDSLRLSFYSQEWADILFERLVSLNYLERILFADNQLTNCMPYKMWQPIGINPLFRIIIYNEGGLLNAHYDDSYINNEYTKSLKSLVLPIQCANKGGSTRFFIDEQRNKLLTKWNFNDKNKPGKEEDLIYKTKKNDEFLLFNHRVLHDGERIKEGQKIIIRTDIIYETISYKEN